jgi:hypothetical protein
VAQWLFDRPAFWGVLSWWLPLSRLWAAALEARGDSKSFVAQVAPRTRPALGIQNVLAAVEARRRLSEGIERDWERAFFGKTTSLGDRGLAAIERRRSLAAMVLSAQRLRFASLRIARAIVPVRFAIPSPSEVRAAYGGKSPEEVFRLPHSLGPVTVSRAITTAFGRDYWVRFPSPSTRVGDTAWARVHEPHGAASLPTLIFGNGVFIEFDHYGRLAGDVQMLVRHGLRVIEIESPWHGRRRKPGYYGGEPFFAQAPLGPLDLFSAQAAELAVLTEWCRAIGGGPVAIGGASMGALAAALAATHAGAWPERYRPDALFLLTAADEIADLAFASSLAERVGLPAALASAGWKEAALAEFRPITAIADQAPLEPERIVTVLGESDRILPYPMGRRLAERWRVPAANLFVGRGGHFATQVGLAWDQRPVARLAEVLRALRRS